MSVGKVGFFVGVGGVGGTPHIPQKQKINKKIINEKIYLLKLILMVEGVAMKINVSSAEIEKHIERCSHVLPSKSLIPILECIYIRIEEDFIEFKASNGDISVYSVIRGIGMEERASLLIKGDILRKLIKEIEPQIIALRVGDNSKELVIETQEGKYTLSLYPPEDYPTLPEPDTTKQFTIKRELLRAAFSNTLFATAGRDNTSTYSINGILMEVENGKATFVATDLKIMAIYSIEGIEGEGADKVRCIIDGEAAEALTGIFRSIEDEIVKVGVGTNFITFEGEDWRMVSKLLPDNFPNYRSVLPENISCQMIFRKKELESALGRITIFAGQRGAFTIRRDDDHFVLHSASMEEIGRVEEHLDGQLTGEIDKISFDAKIFSTLVDKVPGEEVIVKIESKTRPVVISGRTEPGEPEYMGVMVPISE